MASRSKKEKLSSFLGDLGRPTKRGIRKCPKCGTMNGTRGNFCKNKVCDMVFRDTGVVKKSTTDACKILTNELDTQTFSIRLRDRGPDYRNFVQFHQVPYPTPEGGGTASATEDNSNSELRTTFLQPKCYVKACVNNKESNCVHVESTKRCFSESQPLQIKLSVLPTLNISSSRQDELCTMLSESSDAIVQRVSKTSFIVKCPKTSSHPVGYVHIMFFKHNKTDDSVSEKKYLCACKSFKNQTSDNPETPRTGSNTGGGGNNVNLEPNPPASSPPPTSTSPSPATKFCLHYQACMCAFASDTELNSEFEYFITQLNQENSPVVLSNLQFVEFQPPLDPESGRLDSNNISVEIMQENISLLESISASVEEAANAPEQNLEGALSEQIIVTNVEDALSFGETVALEGLTTAESQVCQIYASPDNEGQFGANGYPSIYQTVNVLPSFTGVRRWRQASGEGFMLDTISSIASTSATTSHHSVVTVTTNPMEKGRVVLVASKGNNPSPASATATIPSPSPKSSPQIPVYHSTETSHISFSADEFNVWLCGVNERLNAAMNYEFTGKPDPLVYYITSDCFDYLRERIISGLKKKRLPNHTMIISRTDKPPAGTFTKYVWKITNIFHILQIFHSQTVPLKVRQYFIKGNNGIYEEWISPNENDKKHQPIKPHVHSTYLKVGKSDPNAGESIPFIIEWIPNILPISKLGELTLTFEFGRNSVSKDEIIGKNLNSINIRNVRDKFGSNTSSQS